VETVTILRSLWRHRVAVCMVAVLAIGIGWMVAYRPSLPPESRAYSVGVATAGILIDTPQSQVVAVDPEGSETLAARANVLSNLMVDGEIKSVIAKRVGLSPDQLVASTQSAAAADPPPLDARSHAITTSLAVTSDLSELPIIRVQTQAPDVRQAIALANAAVTSVSEYLDSKAVAETIPDARRLRVRALGTAQGHEALRGPGRVLGLAAAIFVFLAGCGLILAASGLIRTWRTAAAFDAVEKQFAGDGAADWVNGSGGAHEPADAGMNGSGGAHEAADAEPADRAPKKSALRRNGKQTGRPGKRAARKAEAATSRTSAR
jgi:hypothetical protein